MDALPLLAAPIVLLLAAAGEQPPAAPHNDLVIKNAFVMTVTPRGSEKEAPSISGRKDRCGGRTRPALPAGAAVIDAGGKVPDAGHHRLATPTRARDDVNEATSPVTPQMMTAGRLRYQDKAIYRALAGGVTTSLLLHGSPT